MTFKQKLKQSGYTAKSFAQETGTKPGTVAGWQVGRYNPPPVAYAYINLKQQRSESAKILARIIISRHQFDKEGNKIICNCQDCIEAKKELYK